MPSFLGHYQNAATDRERKFERAIESFLKQDYPNKQLVIVSDGCEITNSIVKSKFNHDSIKLVSLDKQPLFSGLVRQLGIDNCNGDIVTYLDSVTGDRCTPIKMNDKIDVIPLEDLFEKFKFLSYYEGEKEIIDIPESLGICTLTPKDKIKCNYENAEKYFFNHFNSTQHGIIKLRKDGITAIEISKMLNRPYSTISQSLKYIDRRIERGIYYITGDWTRIKKIIRHFVVNKDTFLITQKLGQTEITKDHSLIDIVDDEYIESNYENFNDKSFLIVSEFETKKIINFKLSDYINTSKYDLSNGKINVIGRDGINSLINEFSDEDKIFSLVRLLGFYIAEGSTSKRHVSKVWSVDNQKKDILHTLQGDINNISTVKSSFIENHKKGYDVVHRLYVYNKIFTKIFPELCGSDAANKKIPSFIFSLEEKYINEFIKYMYLGDGSFTKKNAYYTTKSLRLISGLSLLLKIINKDHTIVYRDEKKSYGLLEREDVVVRANPKIYKIIKNSSPKFVYDIQVEDEKHMFLDACGCVLLHNSDDLYKNENHLSTIMDAFNVHGCDWMYFNDYIKYFHLDHLPLAERNAQLNQGEIGTSNIAHKNKNDISWIGCDGYNHDYTFIMNMKNKYSNYNKISGTSYTVCHIPNSVDV